MSSIRTPTTNSADVSGHQLIASFTVTNDLIVANGEENFMKYFRRSDYDVKYFKELPYDYLMAPYNTGTVYKSTNGIDFVSVSTSGMYAYAYQSDIYFVAGKYVRWCSNNKFYESSDLSTWTQSSSANFYGYTNDVVVNDDKTILWHYGNLAWYDGTTWYTNGQITDINGPAKPFFANGKWIKYGYYYDNENMINIPAYATTEHPTAGWTMYKETSTGQYSAGWYDASTDRLHFVREIFDNDNYNTTIQTVKLPSATDSDLFDSVALGSSLVVPMDITSDALKFAYHGNEGVVLIPKFDETPGYAVYNLYNVSSVLLNLTGDDTIQTSMVYSTLSDFRIGYIDPLSNFNYKNAVYGALSTWNTSTFPLSSELANVTHK